MTQDAVSNKSIDELKKKVLELCDTIDKQNDLIKKYQRALRIAGDDIVNTERYRAVCKISELACKRAFIDGWKEAAGIE